MHFRYVFLLLVSVVLAGAQIGARVVTSPPLAPAEIAQLETKLQANPADIATRMRLLTHYKDFAPSLRSARLTHILYLIDNRPADPIAASPLTYVQGDPADQETLRRAWLRATDANPSSAEVHVNAARFLYAEHAEDAEETLTRFLLRDPSNRKIAANLGFSYAMDILGMTGPLAAGTRVAIG